MIDRGLIPNQGGVFIDAYNQTINEEITGTILTRINDSCHYFVTESMTEAKIISNPHGFNKGGEKDIAPTCTSSKWQDNSFVLEPMCSVHPNSHKFEFNPETSVKSIAPALRATDYKAPHCVYEPRVRIRKLTPRECFRLMGVADKDINTLQSAGVSNSQQYKLAGNSIVVDVLYHLFRKMFVETENEQQQQTLF